MPRGKTRPLKQVIQTALEAAKAAGFARVRVSTRDGAAFDFSQGDAEPTATDATEPNDFDVIIQKRKHLDDEKKP